MTIWRQKSAGLQSRPISWTVGFLGVVVMLMTTATGQAEDRKGPKTAQRVANLLDEQMQADWQAANVVPTAASDDAEFLRRIFLHLNGTIPDVFSARSFLASNSPDKRQQQIDQCLDGPAYCTHFAEILRDVLIPDSGQNFFSTQEANGFEFWLARQFAQETPYDRIISLILMGDSNSGNQAPQTFSSALDPRQVNPAAFYRSRQAAPENLAAAATRYFLGVRLECAQCHDHPFDHWKQEEFWGMAAFFAGQPVKTEAGKITFRIKIPKTENYATASFLDDSARSWKVGTDSRQMLAEWITARTNQRFSQAIVNRIWGHLFGRGLVDPVDDFNEENPASHPAVLSLLADEFVQHDYDLKFLLRAITYSKTYQLSSRRTHPSQEAPEMFARMWVQGLTASQLRNSLMQASGTRSDLRMGLTLNTRLDSFSARSFESLFPNNAASNAERESSILQSLLMMNSPQISQSVSWRSPGTLAAILAAPYLDFDQKIDTLFLATLTRFPSSPERDRIHTFLNDSTYQKTFVPSVKLPIGNRNQGFSELFWVLLNSSEFCLIH